MLMVQSSKEISLYKKEYRKRPEVIKRELIQRHSPEYLEKARIYSENYRKRPGVRERYKKNYEKEMEINPEKFRMRSRKSHLKHKEKHNKACREYKSKNRKSISNYNEMYYKKYKDRIKAVRKENPEWDLKAQKNYLSNLKVRMDFNKKDVKFALDSWAQVVKKRDDHKCTWCSSKRLLKAHHIWHKAYCPESALDIDNGITLCNGCHLKQHRFDRTV